MTIGYHPTFDGKSSDTRENTIGKSNLEFYDKMLHAIGITKELVWATNCVKCMGRRNPGIPNTCKKNLSVEVVLINPKLIVALGEQAFHALMGDAEDWIPNKEYSYNGRKLITMVSPQTISQNPRYERYWTSAALIIKQHLKQPSLEWWS
jgi:uracil-DNA glycosylase family 4